MIQFETSRTGHPILKKDGRLLASSFDPLKEAHGWAHNASQTPGFEEAESLIVMGLGCGYHVAALSVHAKSIVVIEPDIEVAKATLETLSFEENVTVVIEPHSRQLLTHRDLTSALKNSFMVIAHPASVACSPEYFEAAHKIFLSRDMTSFLFHLRERPDLYAALDEAALQKMAASNEPVNIQTLRQLFRRDGKLSHERRIWKVLEELIA